MKFNLPIILQHYFKAQNGHDIETMVTCFAPEAAVRDEGRNIIGSESIRAWKKETSSKYHVMAEPIECRIEADCTVVAAKVSGNFPGSPRTWFTALASQRTAGSTSWRCGNVRYWHLADMGYCTAHVRFRG